METRRLVLCRDSYRCVICGRDLDAQWSGYSIHHRRLRSHGGVDLNHASNLICLCGSGTTGCHGDVHADPDLAYRHGWLVHAWADPHHSLFTRRHGWILLDQDGTWTPYTTNTRKDNQ
ncbi:HNH endonuclease [Bifidobacterium amazonense]|uniref:HNH endonuclease n=1 Tax=Bifidobacterium amazonense TaxID=2809027 RepID=A0ABS9VSB9_9BIFI|nr:HNH endonuclease signature motif containing protein [Bifidobacterium amazonense]MCH9274980.1 HNH endonuclease [Bifidobacterium amazonense]